MRKIGVGGGGEGKFEAFPLTEGMGGERFEDGGEELCIGRLLWGSKRTWLKGGSGLKARQGWCESKRWTVKNGRPLRRTPGVRFRGGGFLGIFLGTSVLCICVCPHPSRR